MPTQSRSSALTDQEIAELKAQHLACSHLVKGCQDAIIRFREKTAEQGQDLQAGATYRTIEILEEVLASWCDTLSILRSALNQTSSRNAGHYRMPRLIPNVSENGPFWQSAATLNARRS
jgi:hypothetical protein